MDTIKRLFREERREVLSAFLVIVMTLFLSPNGIFLLLLLLLSVTLTLLLLCQWKKSYDRNMKSLASLSFFSSFLSKIARGKGIQEDDYRLLGKGLDMAAKVFASYGIEASYHPHLGSMAEGPDQIDKLFSQTSIKICPDLAHIAAGGGDPLEVVKKYYDRISFVHLKDLDDNGFAPLGTGRLDIDGVLDYLKEQNYEGDYLVEVDGYAGDPVYACKTSYEFLKGKLI